MNRIDRIIVTIIYGGVMPVFLFLAFWWSTIKIIPEKYIFVFAFSGILLGLVFDALYLKRIMKNIFDMNLIFPLLVFLFYSVCIYGFFMGVPVFNAVMGLIAGRYCALRAGYLRQDSEQKRKSGVCSAAVSSFVLAAFCAASAALAVNHKNTPNEIKHMLGLQFEINWTTIWMIIIIGGALLVVAEYYLTLFAFRRKTLFN